MVLSGSNLNKNKAYCYRNIHTFFAYAPYLYPRFHITYNVEILFPNETALWKIQELFARYATPLPMNLGKAETRYNVVA